MTDRADSASNDSRGNHAGIVDGGSNDSGSDDRQVAAEGGDVEWAQARYRDYEKQLAAMMRELDSDASTDPRAHKP